MRNVNPSPLIDSIIALPGALLPIIGGFRLDIPRKKAVETPVSA